jgi:hypothetical protein
MCSSALGSSVAQASSRGEDPLMLHAQAVSVTPRLRALFVVIYVLAFLSTTIAHEAAHAITSALLGGNPVIPGCRVAARAPLGVTPGFGRGPLRAGYAGGRRA